MVAKLPGQKSPVGHQQSPGEGSLMAGCHDESHSLHNNAEARQ